MDLEANEAENNKVEMKIEENKTQPERETWGGKLDFFLSALGFTVGLGAIWRFPYLCYRNGGGVFLIPYFIFMAFVGIPLVFLELSISQFTSSGPLTCWKAVRLFRGIGLSMNIVNILQDLYYNVILGYSLYYLVLSCNSVLPWEKCDPAWKSPNCVDDFSPDKFILTECTDTLNELKCFDDGVCYNVTGIDGTPADCSNYDNLQTVGWYNPQFPSQDFWNKIVLKKSSGIEESGTIVWQLLVSMIVAWTIVLAMLIKGIKISGKIVYFTALSPYVLLLILGINGWTLPGANIGIEFYLKPDLSKLADVNVWADAAYQIFFTFSIACGGLNALASYNKFNHNIMRDAIILSFGNFVSCIFAGFVVFAYLGHLAYMTNQKIDSVVQSGQGLTFVVFPYSVTTLPVAPLWSILFFITMLLLGLDTIMVATETVITSVLDIMPSLREKKYKSYLTITLICFLHVLVGLIFTLNSGTYWIELLDNYTGSWAIFLTAAVETMSIAYLYGIKNYLLDLSIMIGKDIVEKKWFYYFTACWVVLSPLLLTVLTIFVFIQTTPIELDGVEFPYWTHILGQLLNAFIFSGIFVWGLVLAINLLYKERNFKSLLKLVRPDFENWKPLLPENQKAMKIAHGFNSNKVAPLSDDSDDFKKDANSDLSFNE